MSRMTENLNEKTQRANGKKGFFAKHFPPRDFLIRHEDDVRYFTLSTRTQALIFCVLSLCAVWLLFSSFFYVRYDRSVDAKDKQIALLQNAYKDVLKNVAAYEDYALRIEEQLDENHRQMLALDGNAREESVSETAVKKVEPFSLPEESEEEKEFKRLQEERSFLKAQASYVRQRLTTLARGAVSAFRPAEDAVSFKTALLQRDLATSEARELKQRVQDLEEMIAEMQDTQILAFQKMASLADGNITAIEDGLSDISETLKTAGLGMNSLLSRIRRDKKSGGMGGPFIPAAMPKVPNSNLNISLASLNTRLDRWSELTALQNALPLGKPIKRIRVTSPFGAREDPFQGMPARHEAVDLRGFTGEPVYTRAPGKVVRAGMWGWYGNMVEIDHGMGLRTRYAHLDKIFVRKGETVRAGDRIGSVGSTGRSTGAHLHYEIRVRGYAVDPMNFIKAKKNVFQSS